MQTEIWGCAGPQCCCITSCVFDGIVWTFRLWRLCKSDMDGMGSCVGLSMQIVQGGECKCMRTGSRQIADLYRSL